jgi:hypothetical protein
LQLAARLKPARLAGNRTISSVNRSTASDLLAATDRPYSQAAAAVIKVDATRSTRSASFFEIFDRAQAAFPNGRVSRPLGEIPIPGGELAQLICVLSSNDHRALLGGSATGHLDRNLLQIEIPTPGTNHGE